MAVLWDDDEGVDAFALEADSLAGLQARLLEQQALRIALEQRDQDVRGVLARIYGLELALMRAQVLTREER